MQSVALLTFAGNAGTHKLTHAVVVCGEQSPALFNLGSHLGCAALRAEQAEAKLVVAHRIVELFCRFAHIKCV